MNKCGYSGIWSNQTLNVSLNVFKNMIKTRLNDQYCQLWRSDVFESNKCLNYRIFKHTLSTETYLLNLPLKYLRIFSKFRCRNNQLPIETGTRHNIPGDKCAIVHFNLYFISSKPTKIHTAELFNLNFQPLEVLSR